jgi:ABC-type sugar transport system ATPase subunit
VQLRGVGMTFGTQTVLHGIDLDIFPQDTLCVIGESGCGKTVLLKLIVGLLKPTSGEVFFEGVPIHTLSEPALTRLRLRCGFLFQQAALFDSLNVFDNVAFGLRAKGGFSEPRAGSGPPGNGRTEDARGTVRRDAEARGPRPSARARPRRHALRRTDHRPRPHHDGRD